MFDKYSEELFNFLPDLSDIDSDECKRWLTNAYLYCVDNGLSFHYQQDSENNIENTFNNLRRLGSALESAAVFDADVSQEIKKASSFISAESLSLLSKYYKSKSLENGVNPFLLANDYIYTKIESALLYLIAGYDANALTEVQEIKIYIEEYFSSDDDNSVNRIANSVLKLITKLCTFELWNTSSESEIILVFEGGDILTELNNKNQFHFYKLIERSLLHYIKWLCGEEENGYETSLAIIERVIRVSSSEPHASYSTIYHLSKLLETTIVETSRRSVVHTVPTLPEWNDEFNYYIKSRATGNRMLRSRPFLWPSTKQFVEETLPGPNKNSVVSMPTGSGKSFLAELAIAQASFSGWVLYIAPTNSLTHQIKRDLLQGLESLPNIDIRSFVGEEEYTTLSSEIPEFIDEPGQKFVAVMTPEKCSLALRLTPHIFNNCSLCVFDEFHLIAESERGILSDLVMGQIMTLNSSTKFLLMSAMISNPGEVADWLQSKTGIPTSVPTIKWKPTRTLRGAVGLNRDEVNRLYRDGVQWLKVKTKSINRKYSLKVDVLYSLTGVWQARQEDNYGVLRFQSVSTELRASRIKNKAGRHLRYENQHPGWTNNTAKSIGVHLARNQISTIVFFPHDKNHVFSVGDINLSVDSPRIPPKIHDLILIAQMELGTTSQVGELIVNQRVSVHSSAMLEAEKEASEEAFRTGVTTLMFATGTLAQGLNLPAVAVIIAGESVGDRRETGTLENDKRSTATILNAIGRAGRAGFSNQSISLIVPDKPIYFRSNADWNYVRSKLNVLGEYDASIMIESPLESFLDRVVGQTFNPTEASNMELVMVSFLSEIDGQSDMKKSILNNTFAAFRKRNLISSDELEKAGQYIEQMNTSFIEENDAPKWLMKVARKAGVDFFTALRLYETMEKLDIDFEEITDYTLRDWLDVFFLCLKEMPPKFLARLFPDYLSSKNTPINLIHKHIVEHIHEDTKEWVRPDGWDELWNQFSELVEYYMNGMTLKDLASILLNEPVTDYKRSAGKPIPTIISVVNGPIAKLAIFAGLFVAISEEKMVSLDFEIPWNLSALPLAIKNGCNDYSSLCWYRFGIRYRVSAHILAQSFPLDDEQKDDKRARRYVRGVRKLWLEGLEGKEVHSEENIHVLEALRRLLNHRIL